MHSNTQLNTKAPLHPFEHDKEHIWSLQDIGTNAISVFFDIFHTILQLLYKEILNDPNTSLKFQIKGLEIGSSLPTTSIRRVKATEFEPYLHELGDVYEKYQLNRVLGLAAATEGIPALNKSSNRKKHADEKQEGQLEEDLSGSFTSLEEWTARLAMAGSSAAMQLPPLRSNPSSGSASPTKVPLTLSKTRMYSGNAPSLQTIPSIFFDANFNLGNPHTFSAVCEYIDITGVNAKDTFTSQRILQEKLSHYLDVVEVHLIKEISARSSSFFGALSNLQSLGQETQACVDGISHLRKRLQTLSHSSVMKGLSVVRLKRVSGNLDVLSGATKLIHELKQTQPMIQVLLNEGDYVGALDLIEHAGKYLTKSYSDPSMASPASPTLKHIPQDKILAPGVTLSHTQSLIINTIDLKKVKSLGTLSMQLMEVSRTIYSVMESDFIQILLKDLNTVLSTPISVKSIKEKDKSPISIKIAKAPASTWISRILDGKHALASSQLNLSLPDENLLRFEESLKSNLVPVVLGLLRINRFDEALNSYKEYLLKETKNWTKKHYPSNFYVPDDTNTSTNKKDQQSALAKQLRAMSFEKFFDLLMMVYITILHILQRVVIIHALIESIIKEAKGNGLVIGIESLKLDNTPTSSSITGVGTSNSGAVSNTKQSSQSSPTKSNSNLSSPQKSVSSPSNNSRMRRKTLDEDDDLDTFGLDLSNLESNQWAPMTGSNKLQISPTQASESTIFDHLISESANVIASISDLVHVRCAKLVGVRSEQNAMLNPMDFYRFLGATHDFVLGAETITGRICFGLKGTVMSQAKSFISHFHEEKCKQMTLMLENEQWTQAEVPIDFQEMVDGLKARASTSSMNEDELLDVRLKFLEGESDGMGGSISSVQTLKRKDKSAKLLSVNGSKYFVVASALLFLKIVVDYIQCAEQVPTLTADVLNRILELLKLFNSKSCQMVLGAGAMRSAGLKNITARHISLTSQTLGAVIAIIPNIKSSLEIYLPTKQHVLLGDFDRLCKDYSDHQNELHTKLISIMQDRLVLQVQKLLVIQWDSPDSKDMSSETNVSVSMTNLVKDTVNIYKVIIKTLPLKTSRYIMNEIFSSYNKKLEEELKKIDFYTSGGKSRLLAEVQYLIETLSALEDIDGPGNHLEVIVNNIRIKDKRQTNLNPSKPVSSSNVSSTNASNLLNATSSAQQKTTMFFKNMMRPTSPNPATTATSSSLSNQPQPDTFIQEHSIE